MLLLHSPHVLPYIEADIVLEDVVGSENLGVTRFELVFLEAEAGIIAQKFMTVRPILRPAKHPVFNHTADSTFDAHCMYLPTYDTYKCTCIREHVFLGRRIAIRPLLFILIQTLPLTVNDDELGHREVVESRVLVSHW